MAQTFWVLSLSKKKGNSGWEIKQNNIFQYELPGKMWNKSGGSPEIVKIPTGFEVLNGKYHLCLFPASTAYFSMHVYPII